MFLFFSAPGLQAAGGIDAESRAASVQADCATATPELAVAGAGSDAENPSPKVAPPAAGPTRSVSGPRVGGTRWHRLLPGMFR